MIGRQSSPDVPFGAQTVSIWAQMMSSVESQVLKVTMIMIMNMMVR